MIDYLGTCWETTETHRGKWVPGFFFKIYFQKEFKKSHGAVPGGSLIISHSQTLPLGMLYIYLSVLFSKPLINAALYLAELLVKTQVHRNNNGHLEMISSHYTRR